jgi:hypothetical protein
LMKELPPAAAWSGTLAVERFGSTLSRAVANTFSADAVLANREGCSV